MECEQKLKLKRSQSSKEGQSGAGDLLPTNDLGIVREKSKGCYWRKIPKRFWRMTNICFNLERVDMVVLVGLEHS